MTHSRAIFTMILSLGKLFRTFPRVLSPKVRKPANAIAMHAIIEMLVEKCVTFANLSMVGFRSEPYISKLLWSTLMILAHSCF